MTNLMGCSGFLSFYTIDPYLTLSLTLAVLLLT